MVEIITPEEREQGPDANQVRRHAKKMLTVAEYNKKYRRIGYYRPNLKQRDWHGLPNQETAIRAGNQCGKTTAGAAQMTFDAIGWYPAWYTGPKHQIPAIERPFEFLGWAASPTSQTTRDGVQTRLLGDIRQADGLGTGLIPLDNIVGRPTMARGIADLVDTVTLRRETGGRGLIRKKSYEQDRKAYQGESCDRIWLDEDVSRDDPTIHGECQARTVATRGRIYCTLTPLLGRSPLRKRFLERAGMECAEVLMTIHDAAVSKGGHIPDEDIPGIIARYSERERATRAFGADLQGEGAVFTIPVEAIKTNKSPADLPEYCRFIWGADFSHGAMSASAHPFACVLLAHDPMTDVVYVVHAIRMYRALPALHVQAIKAHPCADAPFAWPHDGNRAADAAVGTTFRAMYKKLGLNMRPTHATFPNGSIALEAGITEMENRFASGRLLVFAHLSEVLDEYVNYHRINNLIHKVDDDLLSAVRIGIADIRYAKTLAAVGSIAHRVGQETTGGLARNDWDIFTGRPYDDEPGPVYRTVATETRARCTIDLSGGADPNAGLARGVDFDPFDG
jgi:phage terminase large subunit-like protein